MRVPVESRLTIRDIDPRTGVVVRERVGPNLVTDIGIQSFVALLGGGFGFPTVGANAYEPRTLVRPGTSGCFVGEMQLGQALAVGIPAPGDTSLAGPAAFTGRSYASPATMTVSYPGLGEVAFKVRIPATEHNGELFTEEGLFTHDGGLVARRIIEPAWRKPDGLETEFTHTLRFGRTARALDIVSTIDVSAEVLGALLFNTLIGGTIDVVPIIEGNSYVGRVWSPADNFTIRISHTVIGAIQPRIVRFLGTEAHSWNWTCPNTGPWAAYIPLTGNNANWTTWRVNIGAMIHTGGFIFDTPITFDLYAEKTTIGPFSVLCTGLATLASWGEPDDSNAVSKTLVGWSGACGFGALQLFATLTLTPTGHFSIVTHP